MMKHHEAAGLFPMMPDDVYAEHREDIRVNGQLETIKMLADKVIDGRNRLRACEELGITPRLEELPPDTDPIDYVVSRNLHRNHLTPSQRALAAARVREIYDQRAKERQQAHGNTAPGKKKSLQADLPEVIGQARDEVARVFQVSGRSVDYATKVLKNAVPEVIQAVEEARMSINAAAVLCTEPRDAQRAEAARPKRRRNYTSISKPVADEPDPPQNGKGVGIIRANEAINSLTRIPKNDPQRKRGFQIVTDWIRHNSKVK